jgi:hypothetical protein
LHILTHCINFRSSDILAAWQIRRINVRSNPLSLFGSLCRTSLSSTRPNHHCSRPYRALSSTLIASSPCVLPIRHLHTGPFSSLLPLPSTTSDCHANLRSLLTVTCYKCPAPTRIRVIHLVALPSNPLCESDRTRVFSHLAGQEEQHTHTLLDLGNSTFSVIRPFFDVFTNLRANK